MPASAPAKRPAADHSGFVPLSSGILPFLNSAKVDLFVWNDITNRQVLFHQADVPLEQSRIAELANQCGDYLYVRDADFEGVCDHMLQSLDELTADERIPPDDRFGLLQTAMTFEVERRLEEKDAGGFLNLVRQVGGHVRDLVCENNLLPSSLYSIARHDSATFAHVTNVAGYAAILAQRLGITDSAELNEIIVGGMLHDIGKRHIPKAILAKPGRLTAEEREIINSHPLMGYQDLVNRTDVTHAQRMMVYQHHEQISGKGYPVRILGDEIHPWAKLLAVVDVFDALTGRRPYRRAMTRTEAVEFITERAGTQFDKEIATCWASAIQAK